MEDFSSLTSSIGVELEALNVDAAGEIQYLWVEKATTRSKPHITPAMRATPEFAYSLGYAEVEVAAPLKQADA